MQRRPHQKATRERTCRTKKGPARELRRIHMTPAWRSPHADLEVYPTSPSQNPAPCASRKDLLLATNKPAPRAVSAASTGRTHTAQPQRIQPTEQHTLAPGFPCAWQSAPAPEER